MAVLTAKQVADYFLALQDEDCGDALTNLKLQKLVYYAQGFHLAMKGKPLFDEGIEAWEHGPVVPSLWRCYRERGSQSIPKPKGLDFSKIPKSVRELLDEIYKVYGQFSAWKLRNMTHEEPPWRDTPRDCPIPHDRMQEYFRTLLVEG